MSAFSFPPELELKILQIAATESHRTGRRIQTWIEPILYATIVLNEGNSGRLLRAMEAKGDVFIRQHVKNVWISVKRSNEEDVLFPSDSAMRIENRRCMCCILSKCEGVEKVVVRSEGFYGRVDVSDIWEAFLSSAIHPTHVTTCSNVLQELETLKKSPDNDITASLVVSFLANITHLDSKIVPMDWALYLRGLSAMVPALTHLAMGWSGSSWKPATDPSAMADFVAQHPGMQVILLLARNARASLDVLRSDAFDIGSLRVVLEYDYSGNGGILSSPPAHYGSGEIKFVSSITVDWDDSDSSDSMSTRYYDQAVEDVYTLSARWKWAERKVQRQLESRKHDFSEIIEQFETDLYMEQEYENQEHAGDFEGIWDSD